MKTKLIKAAGILLAGTLVVATAYTNQTQGKEAGAADTRMNAGVDVSAGATSELVAGLDGDTDRSLVSGANGAVSEYLSDTGAVSPEISGTDVAVTALAQEPVTEDEFGYINLGIASVDGNLNVRKAPGTDADVVGKMQNNAGCEILGVEGEWTQIRSGKVEGYVKSEYLLNGDAARVKAQEVKQTVATVTTTTLYVREQPNTDCSIITMMPEGEELEVVETLDGWVKINVDSDEGYVSADYVEISVQLPKAMTMTEVRYGNGVSDVRVSLVQFATQFVGNPYVWGGTSLTRGADCSGFVLSVFANYGISLPHSSGAQAGCGTKISASEAQPGDLFFYGNGSRINHVAIYIGNGQVVHASSPKSGIKISGAYYRTPVKVVRIINN
ncbi:MAG: SH3 domain-containing protein [Roseburia sp.]|jgi:cell wall-associated NlpC family hydrolase|nr:SH3 domain-containing protein [Roseburia sp.]